MCDYCPEEESSEHFLIYCRRYQTERKELEERLNSKNINDFNIFNLLANPESTKDVERFISSTQRFN